jgi:hypothetical protein
LQIRILFLLHPALISIHRVTRDFLPENISLSFLTIARRSGATLDVAYRRNQLHQLARLLQVVLVFPASSRVQ